MFLFHGSSGLIEFRKNTNPALQERSKVAREWGSVSSLVQDSFKKPAAVTTWRDVCSSFPDTASIDNRAQAFEQFGFQAECIPLAAERGSKVRTLVLSGSVLRGALASAFRRVLEQNGSSHEFELQFKEAKNFGGEDF